MVKNRTQKEVKRILNETSKKIANRVDHIIYMNLEGYLCELHIEGVSYPIKTKPTKFQKFILKYILGWEIWEF